MGVTDMGLPPWHWDTIRLQSYWYGLPLSLNHPSAPRSHQEVPEDPHPYPQPTHLVAAGGVRDGTKLLGDGIAHGVGLAIFDVDGTDEQIIGDVVQVPTELEPGAGSRDVVSGTLPFDLGWVSRENRGRGRACEWRMKGEAL